MCTCVYDGLIKILHKNNLLQNITPSHFVTILKTLNKKTNILINNKKLSSKEQIENIERIKSIDNINAGYFCSSSDPILILVCDLYKVNIIHDFNGTIINYTNKKKSNIMLKVFSNSHHFYV